MRMPLHPRLGRLLLRSRELGCPGLGCRIAALLSEKDLFRSGAGRSLHRISSSDIADRLEALNNWNSTGRNDRRIDLSALHNVERIARQLERLTAVRPAKEMYACDDLRISRLLVAAYPDRLARGRGAGDGSYLLAGGRGARISERSGVRGGEYIVALALDAGNQAEAIIHLAAEIPEYVIREERAGHIRSETSVSWNEREGRVIARRLECLGSMHLSTETVVPSAAQAVPAVIGAVRASGLSLLSMNEAFRQLQGRLMLLRSAFPERDWPDVSDAVLTDRLEEWLAPHLEGINSAKRIAQLNIAEIVRQSLDYRQQRELDELAPTHLPVPSGSRVRIDYADAIPVLAVKLQELFGLAVGPSRVRRQDSGAAASAFSCRKADSGDPGFTRVLGWLISAG